MTGPAARAPAPARGPAVPDRLLPWIGILAVLASFELASRSGVVSSRNCPAPPPPSPTPPAGTARPRPRSRLPPVSEMFAALGDLAVTAAFWDSVWNTLQGWDRVAGPPERMALVFQEYSRSLFPWMTVRQNVAFPLRRRELGAAERAGLVEEAVESVGLTAAAERYPWQLSGGMQQRVAIARALAYQSTILLMDEPFASVDAQTRADLEDLVLEVRERYRITTVFVTHDIDESVYLSDRVIVLTPSPTSVYEVLEVDLPAPRDQVVTKELPEFAHLRAHVWRSIKRPDTVVEAVLA